jgi:hypothetical protein
MKRWLLSMLAAALMLPAPAGAAIRAVFVGIDHYQFSRSQVADAGFDDLSGAVGDVLRIKQALGQALQLPFDVVPAGQCRASNRHSITLLDNCATKASIMASWRSVVRESRAQDTIILYFAGHGSRFIDSATLDQASRFNSTLMASDARQPGAAAPADIFDHEVRGLINLATSRGVRVVTLFDSCNSGTANRSGTSASRTAPDLPATGLVPVQAPAQYGNLGAWRVHLAAAGDGQDAAEVGSVGNRAGVFTTALAKAVLANPQASFADLAARVVVEVRAATNGRQVPHAEGALRATFGGAEIRVPTFAVVTDGGRLLMQGGALLGITPGSRFALYAETSDALRAGSNAPLATGLVAAIGNSMAELRLEAAPAAPLPGRLVAREVDHEFGGPVLAVAVADPAARAAAASLRFVRVDARSGFALVPAADGMVLQARSGLVLARLPLPDAPQFRPQLAAALGKIARVEQWLAALRSRPELCLAVSNAPSRGYDPGNCPPGGVPQRNVMLKLDAPMRLGVVNRATAPRFVHVFHISPKYEVNVVLPAFGGRDKALLPGAGVRDGADIYPTDAGDQRLVALATDLELDVSVLEQSPTDAIDGEACLSAVARAFCQRADTSRGRRGGEAARWSAVVMPVRVVP